MNIKQASLETGLSEDILRFYEKKNLIHPTRNPNNGYRDYTTEDIWKIIQIRQYNTLGISLHDIEQIFQNEDPGIGLNSLDTYLQKMEEEKKWMDIKIASAKDLYNTFLDIRQNKPFRILENRSFHYYKKPEPGSSTHEDYEKTINQIQALNYSFRIEAHNAELKNYPNDVGIISMLPLPVQRLIYTPYKHVTLFRIYYPSQPNTLFHKKDYKACEKVINDQGYKIISDCFCSQIFTECHNNSILLSVNFIVAPI